MLDRRVMIGDFWWSGDKAQRLQDSCRLLFQFAPPAAGWQSQEPKPDFTQHGCAGDELIRRSQRAYSRTKQGVLRGSVAYGIGIEEEDHVRSSLSASSWSK